MQVRFGATFLCPGSTFQITPGDSFGPMADEVFRTRSKQVSQTAPLWPSNGVDATPDVVITVSRALQARTQGMPSKVQEHLVQQNRFCKAPGGKDFYDFQLNIRGQEHNTSLQRRFQATLYTLIWLDSLDKLGKLALDLQHLAGTLKP